MTVGPFIAKPGYIAVAVSLALGTSGAAFAQQEPPPDGEESTARTLDSVRVTGSRIARANVEGPAPVVVITALYGSEGTAKLLVFSQVLLSMQLPFAVIPLVRFVTDREKMGRFVVAPWLASLAWVIAAIIVVLNVKLLFDTFAGG